MTSFYRGTIESILTYCLTAWYGNCTEADRKSLQRIVRAAEKIIGAPLPRISDIYTDRCVRKAMNIMTDPFHPSHHLFELLPSGRRLKSLGGKTSRSSNSFFPNTIRTLNARHILRPN